MVIYQLWTRLTHLVGFLQCQLTETVDICRPTLTHYTDYKPASICFFYLMTCAQRRSNKYQSYSLFFFNQGSISGITELMVSMQTITPLIWLWSHASLIYIYIYVLVPIQSVPIATFSQQEIPNISSENRVRSIRTFPNEKKKYFREKTEDFDEFPYYFRI